MRAWISLILLMNQVSLAQDAGVHVRLVATQVWNIKAEGDIGVGYDGKNSKTRQIIAKVAGKGCDVWSAWREDSWHEARFSLPTRRDCEPVTFRFGAPVPQMVGVRLPGRDRILEFAGPEWSESEGQLLPTASQPADPHWEQVATALVQKACRSVPHDQLCFPPQETLERPLNWTTLSSQRVGRGTWSKISFGVRWVARGPAKYVSPVCSQSTAPEGWHRVRAFAEGVLVVNIAETGERVSFPEVPVTVGDELVFADIQFMKVEIVTHRRVVGGGPIRVADFEFTEPP